eukprot:TRINITY_DN5899_c0_g1_i3.p1 TRINITY_DN5899_c0_g1~~TRINITY_DN5899_c0_g1_i3.p1  ORF type:complete len:712 (+),score=195.32 TRINITY_DN5899_c0_g1_i3:279-2138(+)
MGRTKFKTAKASDTLNPQWNEAFVFDRVEPEDVLKIRVRNKVMMGKGYLFGEIAIPVIEIPTKWERRDIILNRGSSSNNKKEANAVLCIQLRQEIKEKSESSGLQRTESGYNSQDSDREIGSQAPVNLSEMTSQSVPTIPTVPMIVVPTTSSSQQPLIVSSSLGTLPPSNTYLALRNSASSTQSVPIPIPDKMDSQRPSTPSNGSPATTRVKRESDIDRVEYPEMEDVNEYEMTDSDSDDDMDPPLVLPDALTRLTPEIKLKVPSVPTREDRAVRKVPQKFCELFEIPQSESLLFDYTPALLRKILHHGRLYICTRYVCFISQVVGIKLKETFKISDISELKKESRHTLSPGVTIKLDQREFHFTSFENRNLFYDQIYALWKGFELPRTDQVEDFYTLSPNSISAFTSLLDVEEESLKHKQLILEDEVPMTVDQFFKMIYSDDSPFSNTFIQTKKGDELFLTKWSPYPRNGQVRTLTYRTPVEDADGVNIQGRIYEVQRYELKKDWLTIYSHAILHDSPYYSLETVIQLSATTLNRSKVTVAVDLQLTKKIGSKGKTKTAAFNQTKQEYGLWLRLIKSVTTKKSEKSLHALMVQWNVSMGLLILVALFILREIVSVYMP